jgi:hypothetical protein
LGGPDCPSVCIRTGIGAGFAVAYVKPTHHTCDVAASMLPGDGHTVDASVRSGMAELYPTQQALNI